MFEKTRQVPLLADATYAHTLVIESTHEYKVHGPYGSNFPLLYIRTLPSHQYNLECCKKFWTKIQVVSASWGTCLVFSDIISEQCTSLP